MTILQSCYGTTPVMWTTDERNEISLFVTFSSDTGFHSDGFF